MNHQHMTELKNVLTMWSSYRCTECGKIFNNGGSYICTECEKGFKTGSEHINGWNVEKYEQQETFIYVQNVKMLHNGKHIFDKLYMQIMLKNKQLRSLFKCT